MLFTLALALEALLLLSAILWFYSDDVLLSTRFSFTQQIAAGVVILVVDWADCAGLSTGKPSSCCFNASAAALFGSNFDVSRCFIVFLLSEGRSPSVVDATLALPFALASSSSNDNVAADCSGFCTLKSCFT